ncbi:DUF2079 domain-containing protein [Ruania alkalisoli]|uniref:DUF2079 domain-containing protein n=1 Tax=Ruania alkalisoli TaxID=2779775 RepID=A0A7M1SW10_9MICO|nr:DUF2079 domain-containing protein [Ruania alkalisoli]QOR71770.1 DUF2079 domain-containing protein [Ruania alkalisoli]
MPDTEPALPDGGPSADEITSPEPGGRWGGVRGRPRLLTAAAVGVLTSAVYVLFSVRQWARFESPSWDLGIFTQLLRAYAEVRSPIVPIKGEGFMLLGDHFHPLLALLAPFYAVAPSGLTLLVLQNVLIGISAAVLTGCTVRHLGVGAGSLIGLAYGLSWGLQSAVASQFHEIALALPFLTASCAALVRRDHRAAVLWALPLLGIKEDLGLTVAMVGVVAALRGSRRLGLVTAVGGVGAFVLVTQVILPALNPDGVWDYADDSIVATLLADPGAAVGTLFTGAGAKASLVVMVFLPTAFLALRSPLALITLPTFAWRLSSDVPFHWSTDWHYSAILMPVVLCATVDALLVLRWRRYAAAIGAGLLALAVAITTQFPLWRLADAGYYRDSADVAGAEQVLAAIPDGASVATDITLMAYLAPRTTVYWVGNVSAAVGPDPVDYVVVHTGSGVYGQDPPQDVVAYATAKFPGSVFTEVLDAGGFLVAERVG